MEGDLRGHAGSLASYTQTYLRFVWTLERQDADDDLRPVGVRDAVSRSGSVLPVLSMAPFVWRFCATRSTSTPGRRTRRR